MIGRTISHYQVLDKLGSGGMGEIYKAQDSRLNRIFRWSRRRACRCTSASSRN